MKNITGTAELSKVLQSLGPKVYTRGCAAAVNKAARIVAKKAKQFAPCRTGLLANSIKVKSKRIARKMKAYALVGPENKAHIATDHLGLTLEANPGKYGHLVEFGHGGPYPAPAHPFLGPALDSTASACQEAIAGVLRIQLEKAAKETA